MNQKLKSVLTILLVYASSIFLSIILMELGGYLHSYIFDTTCTGSIFIMLNFDNGCKLEGFIYFYIFWLAIFAFSLLKQKTAWIVYVIGTILFWAVAILIIATENLKYLKKTDIGSLIIMICFFTAGWLLAQGGLLVYKRLKR